MGKLLIPEYNGTPMYTDSDILILRGSEYSGKTHHARHLQEKHPNRYELVQLEDFYEKECGGKFDPARIADAHAWCREKTWHSLRAGKQVIVANVNTKISHMKPYFVIAEKLNKTISVVRVFGYNQPISESTGRSRAVIMRQVQEYEILTPAKLEKLVKDIREEQERRRNAREQAKGNSGEESLNDQLKKAFADAGFTTVDTAKQSET